MCEICYRSPCDPRCPNAPQPEAVFVCKSCGEDIVEGEDYYELDGEHYHEECFKDEAVSILEDKYGAEKGVAEVEAYFDDE
ncbi:MAG: hypothetical protein II897_03800 [Clostridia bacterium]|nr:hypothetical protein [Clostridia bacterium]